MLSDGEWEAIDWYFRLYSTLSICMPLKFNLASKKLSSVETSKEIRYVFLLWVVYQLICVPFLLSVWVLLNQRNEVPIVQIIFFFLYCGLYLGAFLPSYMIAIDFKDIQNLLNSVTSMRSNGKNS